MVSGLIPVTAGELLLNGKVIDGTNVNRGMVFQKHTLFPWLTLRQNVEFSFKMSGKLKDIKKILKMILKKKLIV